MWGSNPRFCHPEFQNLNSLIKNGLKIQFTIILAIFCHFLAVFWLYFYYLKPYPLIYDILVKIDKAKNEEWNFDCSRCY